MKNDFLKTLETSGYTARLKRISDSLIYDARRVYTESKLDIEPNWHLIFLLLKQEKKLTVTEISNFLGFSHPAIIKIIKKMKMKGYLESTTDSKDSRKQLIQLSKKAIYKLPEFEKEWYKIKKVIDIIIDKDTALLINKLEEKLQYKGLFQTYKDFTK